MTTGNIAAGNIAKISGLPRDTDIMQYRKTTLEFRGVVFVLSDGKNIQFWY